LYIMRREDNNSIDVPSARIRATPVQELDRGSAEHDLLSWMAAGGQRRRLAVKGKVLGRRRLTSTAGIVTRTPSCGGIAGSWPSKYDGSKRRRPGRPSTKPDIAALVVRMATENPTWGYTRIRGGLKAVGHVIARNTIKAILEDHGIEPAARREDVLVDLPRGSLAGPRGG
jgi:hypothetical protein